MDHYRTVFEITQKGFDWWFPAAGLGAIALGAIFIKFVKSRHWLGYFMVGFATLWTLSVVGSTLPDYYKAHKAYRTGQYSVAEGPVEDFRPMPPEGHQLECFSVQVQTFCYSDYVVTAGFNNSASHGGPIRKGLPVRVSYIGNTIVRLEVASSPPSPPAAAKTDPLGLYGPENQELTDCLNRVNPDDPAGLRGETKVQATARKACVDKYAH